MPELRANAREQHAELERFRDIVVRARIEPEDRIRVAVRGGQHDDRHPDIGPAEKPAHVPPVHVGQADIEKDQVEMLRLDRFQGLRPVVRRNGVEFLVELELLCQGLAKRSVVIDQQDLLARLSHANSTSRMPVPWTPANALSPAGRSRFDIKLA